MTTSGFLIIDVGGTSIKSCLVSKEAFVLDDTVLMYDAKAKASTETILSQFITIISDQVKNARNRNLKIQGIGFGFPGPFDYDQGICLIQGLDKYDAIYKVNLRTHITQQIQEHADLGEQFNTDLRILFINDADAFALGESHFGRAKSFQKIICLTLGTGIGASFIEEGRIVNHLIPLQGRIHLANYHDGVAETYISRRGIIRIATSLGIDCEHMDVIDLANLATQGHLASRKVFIEFGRILGEVMIPFIRTFKPNCLSLGGQISKSAPLFLPAFHEQIDGLNVEIVTTDNSLYSTWLGIYLQFVEAMDVHIPERR